MSCKCPACGGKHTAWAKECPKAVQAKQRAREAYQHRPRTFETATATKPIFGPPTQFTHGLPQEDTDDFQVVGSRKRRRGRPVTSEVLQRAGQQPGQARLIFSKDAQEALQALQAPQGSQVAQVIQDPQGTQEVQEIQETPQPTQCTQPTEDSTMDPTW